MIGCFIVHLYLYLDGACGPAQPCIADNGDHREQADGELEPIGIDVAEHHAVVDDANEEGADDPAEDGADAAGERRPANDRGGDRLQLQSDADGRQWRIETEYLDQAGEAGERRAENEADDLDPVDRDAH